jgi:hypothetical protein
MVFWRIDELKRQLRRGPLPQRQAFGYVALTWVLFELFSGAPGLWNDARSGTLRDWAAYVAGVITIGVGTYAAYRANGGGAGRDFAARFVALGFVVGLRLLVLVVIPATVLFEVIIGIAGVEPAQRESGALAWAESLLVLVVAYVLFMARVAAHLRDVASVEREPTPSTRPVAGAAGVQ